MSTAPKASVSHESVFAQPCVVNIEGSLPEYQYQPIRETDSIRILKLAPGTLNDALRGSLEVVNIENAGSYEPLSYVWSEPGPSSCSYEILLGDSNGETVLSLEGGSLFAALRCVRLPNVERRIWADQICINQKDTGERSQQVQFMNRIYAKAKHVLVWLGLDEEGEARAAFSLIHVIDKKLDGQDEEKEFRDRYTNDLDQAVDHRMERR